MTLAEFFASIGIAAMMLFPSPNAEPIPFGDGTNVGGLEQWTSTSSPQNAITQKSYGKPLKLTGLTALLPVCIASNGLATTTGCTVSGGSGSGTVGTSTIPNVGDLAYWTSAGYPSLLGSVATGTLSCTSPLSCTARSVIGGSSAISLSTAGDWTGTLDGYEASAIIAAGFSTTSADVWKGLRDFFSTTSAQYFVHSSTTIPKTYTANTFTALQTFANASSTLFSTLYASSTQYFGAGLSACDPTTGKLTWSNGLFSCGTDQAGEAGGGITSLGPTGQGQTGATQTFATSSDTNVGLTITSSANTHTFTSTWSGTLAYTRGGTGTSTPAALGHVLHWNGSNWQGLATSSLNIAIGDTTGTLAINRGGTGATTLNDLITLTTHTSGNYVATLADDGQSTVTVTNGSAEGGAATLRVIDVVCTGCLGSTEIAGLDISADTNLAVTYPITLSNDTVGFSGLATSSPWTGSGVAYRTSGNTVSTVATSSATCSTGVSCTAFDVLGSAAPVITAALGTSVDLASAEVTGTLPIANGGTGTTTTAAGYVAYWGSSTLLGTPTTTVSCSGSTSCTSFTVFGSSPITISSTGGAGGTDVNWTFASNKLGLYPSTTSLDVWMGSSATSTAPFWFDVSATTTYIGNGGTGDSILSMGPTVKPWTLGYDDTDGSWAIASSTTLGTNNVITIQPDKEIVITDENSISGWNPAWKVIRVPYATSTAWTGTTTIYIGPAYAAMTVRAVYCETNTGTVGVSLYDGTNRANYIPTASTTINRNAYSSNNTFTAGESQRVDYGTPASSPTKVTCTFGFTYDAD